MSTTFVSKSLSHAEIAREIRRAHPGVRVSSNMVGQIRRGDTTSATLEALIPVVEASLIAKAKAERKGRKSRKAVA